MNQNRNENNQNKCEENEFLASFSQGVNVEGYESCTCSSTCIRNEITNVKNKIERIEEKLDAILQKMDNNLIKNCDKIGDHVDFVNNVYDTVKVPLHYLSNKVQKMIGVNTNRHDDAHVSNKIEDCQQPVHDSNDDEYLFTEIE
jgi:hypothetical protein